jgi:hypothetical protein
MLRQTDWIARMTREELATLDGLLFGTERLVDALESTFTCEQGPPLRQRLDAMRRELERLVDSMQIELLARHARQKRGAGRLPAQRSGAEQRLGPPGQRDASQSSFVPPRAASPVSGLQKSPAALSA